MNESYTFEQIEQYLAGDLSAEERHTFEARVQEDQSLAQELAKHQQGHTVIDLYAREQIKQKVATIQAQQNQTVSWSPTLYRLAATVLLIAIAFGAYYFSYQTYSDQALAADHFQPYPNRLTTMGELDDESFFQAMAHYDKGEYRQALVGFEQVEATSEHYNAAQLYLGIAYYSIGQYEQAVDNLSNLAEASDPFSEAAQWYLALAYLQSDQEQQAVDILQTIVSTGAYQSQAAASILDKMDSPLRSLPGI